LAGFVIIELLLASTEAATNKARKAFGASVGIGARGSAENTREHDISRNCESCRAHILFCRQMTGEEPAT